MSAPHPVSGKRVLITGATSGIGKATALELARRGADLAVIGRDPAKSEQLAEEVAKEASGAAVRFFRADLAELAQVRSVAELVTDALDGIDVLVNNAGIAAVAPRTTADGFDEMLAANYLGPFLLTHLLLDTVRASAPSRIVVTGSEAHRFTGRFDPERFEDLGSYSGVGAQMAYGRTKLLDILFADELARRLSGTNVTVNSMCPGLVNTDLAREVPVPGMGRIARLLQATPLIRTPAQGAKMLVHLAADADVEGMTGKFCTSTPGAGLLPTAGPRRDPKVAHLVYERTCKLVGVDPI